MFTQSRLRVFLPTMLIAFLFFGAVSAEAGDRYHRRDRRDGDRAAKGAVVGAALGALVQLVGGRTEGGQVLKGAVVGGVLGAAVGASRDGRYDHNRGGYYDQNGYDQTYYDQNGGYYNQDGYYVQVDDGYNQDGYGDPNAYYGNDEYDGRYDQRNDQQYDQRYDQRYERDNGYDHRDGHRGSHRHGSHCGHR
jgi:hypothetical protein